MWPCIKDFRGSTNSKLFVSTDLIIQLSHFTYRIHWGSTYTAKIHCKTFWDRYINTLYGFASHAHIPSALDSQSVVSFYFPKKVVVQMFVFLKFTSLLWICETHMSNTHMIHAQSIQLGWELDKHSNLYHHCWLIFIQAAMSDGYSALMTDFTLLLPYFIRSDHLLSLCDGTSSHMD